MSIYRRGKTWYIDYYVNGRRARESVGPNKREAEKAQRARLTDVQRGKFRLHNPKKISFTTFSELYLDRHAAIKLSGNRDQRTLRLHLVPHFGSVRLTSISSKQIAGYQATRVAEVKPASVNREIALLKTMFNLAVKWGYADKNPVKGIRFLRENNLTQRILSQTEESRLLEAAKEPVRSFIILALHTGLHRGELLALQWEDVNLPFRQLLVKRSKGGTARKVPLNETAFQTLLGLGHVPSGPVLPEHFRALDHHFKYACRKAGISGLRIHDLRHSFASRLVANGVDLVTVKDLLGHAVILTTMRYAHSRAHQQAVQSLVAGSPNDPVKKDVVAPHSHKLVTNA